MSWSERELKEVLGKFLSQMARLAFLVGVFRIEAAMLNLDIMTLQL